MPDDRMQMIFWVENGDFEAFETAMDDDPTVSSPTVLTDAGDRRLYMVDPLGEGRETSIIPLVVKVGGVHLDLTATHEGWRNRIQFPNREALEQVFRFCHDHEIEFTFNRIYDQSNRFEGTGPELTEAQQETLIEAVNCGYLSVPRECSLAELGERLGISESATSERFRRAVKALVEQTISP
jgi:predicted DNA binding protein